MSPQVQYLLTLVAKLADADLALARKKFEGADVVNNIALAEFAREQALRALVEAVTVGRGGK